MGPQVLQNLLDDQYDAIVLLFSSILIIALGSLPLVLWDELIWSLLIWVVAISALLIGYRRYDLKKVSFGHIGDGGFGLQFKNGRYREVDWEQVEGIEPVYGPGDGRWLLLVVPFVFWRGEEDDKKGILLLDDGSKHRVSWKIAEAILSGYQEATGKWPL